MVLSKTSCYNRLDHRGWKRRLIISISRGLWLWFWCRKAWVLRWEVNKKTILGFKWIYFDLWLFFKKFFLVG
jgi:hypothetical protein